MTVWEKIDAIYESSKISSESTAIVIAAIIGVIGMIIQIGFTIYNNKQNEKKQNEIEKNNQDFQRELTKKNNDVFEKWEQNKIDANLKANARIEWIQKVKEVTSELIESISLLIESEVNIERELEIWVVLQKKIYLLMLQFGPDDDSNEIKPTYKFNEDQNEISFEIEAYKKIRDRYSNEGKNNLIVSYLEALLSYVKFNSPANKNKIINKNTTALYEMIKNEELTLYLNGYLNDLNYNNLTDKEYFFNNIGKVFQYIESGMYDSQNTFFDDDEEEKEIKKIEKIVHDISKLKQVKKEYTSYISDLTEIIRTYLKIERDIAKEGK